jgi:hypothetical protein
MKFEKQEELHKPVVHNLYYAPRLVKTGFSVPGFLTHRVQDRPR